MSYLDQETSVEAGQPVELYVFQTGVTTYRYTSAEDVVTFAGNPYVPKQITRTDPAQSEGDRQNDLTVTLPAEDPVCSALVGVVPGEATELSIIRFHRGDVEAYNLWGGRVVNASYKKRGAVCHLRCITSETAFSRSIPRYRYQSLCNHELYDANCTALKASFKHTGLVSAVSGRTITVDGLLTAEGAGWSQGGYVDLAGVDPRVILEQDGDTLTLMLPFNVVVLGQNVDVYAGCGHTISVCASKFSNDINFGGFPYVPTKNPFARKLL